MGQGYVEVESWVSLQRCYAVKDFRTGVGRVFPVATCGLHEEGGHRM